MGEWKGGRKEEMEGGRQGRKLIKEIELPTFAGSLVSRCHQTSEKRTICPLWLQEECRGPSSCHKYVSSVMSPTVVSFSPCPMCFGHHSHDGPNLVSHILLTQAPKFALNSILYWEGL